MQNVKNVSYDAIIQHALEMFKTRGIKGVRMEDVSKELKISKRTLYERFSDKEELLLECVKLNAKVQWDKCTAFMSHSDNVMEILCFFLKNTLEEFSKYNSKFFVEVIKYRSVREFLDNKAQQEAEMKKAFFRRAVDEGLIVPGLDDELMGIMHRAAVDNLLKEKAYEKWSLQKIFITFIMLFMRGILTERGRKELDLYLTL